MKDEFELKTDLLLKEMDLLQASIRSYDSILFTIKGWAISAFSAFVFFSVRERDYRYVAVGAAVVCLFWTLDAIYKGFQRTFIVRYNRIEHFLRTEFSAAVQARSFGKFNLPDVGARVSVKDKERKTSALRAAFYWHTSLLYAAMLLFLAVVSAWI